MKYSFHPAAEAELIEAVGYYDQSQAGLGSEFLKGDIPHHTEYPCISRCLVATFYKYPKVPLETVSLRSRLLHRQQRGVYHRCYEPQQKARVLEGQRERDMILDALLPSLT